MLTIYNANNNANETALANGAAIQCACWSGVSSKELQKLLFIDLLPHDICMKTDDGFETVVPKGSSIPTRKLVEVEIQEKQRTLTVSLYRRKEEEFVVRVMVASSLAFG